MVDEPKTTISELEFLEDIYPEIEAGRLTWRNGYIGLPEWNYRGVVRDISGQRFGQLTVVGLTGFLPEGKRRVRSWLCRCDCGEELIIDGARLRSGNTKSCGCRRRDSAKSRSQYRDHAGLFVSPPENMYG
jgi:hypothetical protein